MTCDCSPACRLAAETVESLADKGQAGARLVAILPAGTRLTDAQEVRWVGCVLAETRDRTLVLAPRGGP